MYKSYSMELAGRTLTVDIDRVAKQANGAAFMHYGDTVVLSTATASEKPREGIDFFPLSVEYEEKMYAVGKIPGGFNKREGKASEHAILFASSSFVPPLLNPISLASFCKSSFFHFASSFTSKCVCICPPFYAAVNPPPSFTRSGFFPVQPDCFYRPLYRLPA